MEHKWRTSIIPSYKRRCVLKASFAGGLGVAVLVGAGSFMPVSLLEWWGLPIFGAAGALIVWSMLPYRQLTQLENKPDELWLNADESLTYAKKGIPTLTFMASAFPCIHRRKKKSVCMIQTCSTPACSIPMSSATDATFFFLFFRNALFKTFWK
jgi:hypothetical protein